MRFVSDQEGKSILQTRRTASIGPQHWGPKPAMRQLKHCPHQRHIECMRARSCALTVITSIPSGLTQAWTEIQLLDLIL
jgi:hypothetical protein